jgi:hypothetical protein
VLAPMRGGELARGTPPSSTRTYRRRILGRKEPGGALSLARL